MRQTACHLVAALALVHLGCSAEVTPATRTDAGSPVVGASDATAAVDAGSPVSDATTGDASLPPRDAGSSVDAAPVVDAASAVDAATTVDAAPIVDAALAVDAATCSVPLDATVSATMTITADDHFKLYVNGATIDETARIWSSVQTYTVNLFRHPSRKNVIAIEGINTAKIDGFDRGIVADLVLSNAAPEAGSADGGAPARIVTDATWKVSTALASGWNGVTFDDAAWGTATAQGANGMAPWGPVLGSSNAQWIWSFASNGSAASKATTETVFVRKSFYLTRDLAVSATPSACP
jgi:hypothetical protein